jgi:hypothetical protein
MLFEKDAKSIAIIEVMDNIHDSLVAYYEDNKNEIENASVYNPVSIDDNDWSLLLTEYIMKHFQTYLIDKIQADFGDWDSLKDYSRMAVHIMSMIKDNRYEDEFQESMAWKDLYFHILKYLSEESGSFYVKVWVNVYHITRRFGGHEEGGWYYNWRSLEDSIHVHYDEAHIYEAKMKEKHGEGHGNIYSVNGGVEVDICIEANRGESRDTERPYYS